MSRDPIYKQIGHVIQRRRKQLGLKQFALASALGVSRGSLANVETGRQSILVHQLYKIAQALKLSPSDLLPPGVTPTPAHQDWTEKLPPGLKPQQQEQIARLLEATDLDSTRQKREINVKSSNR